MEVPAYVLDTGVGSPDLQFYSTGLLDRVGFQLTTTGLLADTESTPSQDEEDRLRAALLAVDPDAYITIERGPDTSPDPRTYVIIIVAALITIGAATIATGLAAADGRADLVLLGAVGASPRLRRRLVVNQAGLIAGVGSILGTVVGLGAVFAAMSAYNNEAATHWPVVHALPLVVPWATVAAALVVPAVAMIGAGLFTRSRLPIERTRE